MNSSVMPKPNWKTPSEFLNEVADLLEQADDAEVTHGKFMDGKGCLCPLGLVSYKYSSKAQKAIEGFRSLRESGVLDQDILGAIQIRVDDVVLEEVKWLLAKFPLEARYAVSAVHDDVYMHTHDKGASVKAIRQAAKEFES